MAAGLPRIFQQKFCQKTKAAFEQESVFLLVDRHSFGVIIRRNSTRKYGVAVLFFFQSRDLSRLVTSHYRLKGCEVYPLLDAFQLASSSRSSFAGLPWLK